MLTLAEYQAKPSVRAPRLPPVPQPARHVRDRPDLLDARPAPLVVPQRARPQIHRSVWRTNIALAARDRRAVLAHRLAGVPARRGAARRCSPAARGHLALLRAAPVRGHLLEAQRRTGATPTRPCAAARTCGCRRSCSSSPATSASTTCTTSTRRSPTTTSSAPHDELAMFHSVPKVSLWDGLRAVRLKLWDETSAPRDLGDVRRLRLATVRVELSTPAAPRRALRAEPAPGSPAGSPRRPRPGRRARRRRPTHDRCRGSVRSPRVPPLPLGAVVAATARRLAHAQDPHRPRRLHHRGCHRLEQRGHVRAPARPAEQLAHLVREAPRDRDPDEPAVVVADLRACELGIGRELTVTAVISRLGYATHSSTVMSCIVSGSGSPSTYIPGGFSSCTRPRATISLGDRRETRTE